MTEDYINPLIVFLQEQINKYKQENEQLKDIITQYRKNTDVLSERCMKEIKYWKDLYEAMRR